MPLPPRRVLILGSTGSIGTQTLDVIAHLNRLHDQGLYPQRFTVVGLAARRNTELLFDQATRFGVPHLALADEDAPLGGPSTASASLFVGEQAPETLVREVDCDLVVAAMVGSAGLPAAYAALTLGRDVAIANKETLVGAGALMIDAARVSGSALLPIDSEHAALWQCLRGMLEPLSPADPRPAHTLAPPCRVADDITHVTLTASGGPFRTWPAERIAQATAREALKHPTWAMGRKNTIDSASMINKALEVIEAHWLFGLRGDQIRVAVQPQSIVHAIVHLADGSLVAQLATPDMRLPIQQALTHPRRTRGQTPQADLPALASLAFESPDLTRFPALGLAWDVINTGGTAGAILTSANEAAVDAFLDSAPSARPLPFAFISDIVAQALREIPVRPLRTLQDCLAAEAQAREFVTHAARRYTSR